MNMPGRNARLFIGPTWGTKPLPGSIPGEGSHTALGILCLLSCAYNDGFEMCLHCNTSHCLIPFAVKIHGIGASCGSTH